VDTGIGAVLPYGVIKNKEKGIRNKELVELIKKEKIDRVVVGLPMSLNGEKENTNTKRIREFANELEKETKIPIEFFNEMFDISINNDSLFSYFVTNSKSKVLLLSIL
jgi:putative Holliday junction resolvase